MTAKETIEILQEEHDYAQLLSYVNAAIKTAIEALEKQIPQKPELKPIDGFDNEVASSLCCPTCKNSVINYWCKKINPPHCMMCGQALDWSENND